MDSNGLKLKWLYIDMNSYFASVEQQLNPALRGKPVAVVPVETDATSVIAASYEAKKLGIKTGTPVYEAKRLCPKIALILARHDKYVEYHERVKDEINNHIPVTQTCSIDEFACILMDNESSVEYVTKLAERIKKGILENIGVAITCSIGIASNKYLAKVAADMQKPNGFTLIEPDQIEKKLGTLKLSDLPGVGRNMHTRLNVNNIYTVKELLSYSSKHLRKIWHSVWGEKMWYLMRGVEIPDMETTKRHVGHSHMLSPEMRPEENARYIGRRLTLKAASRMRRYGYYAKRLSLSARFEDRNRGYSTRYFMETSFKAVMDNISLLERFESLWKQINDEAEKNLNLKRKYLQVKKISVTLHGLVENADVMPDFFNFENDEDDKKLKKSERLSKVIDDLNKKYGRDTASFGMMPTKASSGFTGTKIAFSRIPEMDEFHE